MASENIDGNLNIHEGTEENVPPGGNCDTDNQNIIKEANKVEVLLPGDIIRAGNDGEVDLVLRTENIDLSDIAKEEMPSTKNVDMKCDNCTSDDVENISNILAEKVTIGNQDSNASAENSKCDPEDAEVARATVTSENLNMTDISKLKEHPPDSQVIVRRQSESLRNLLVYHSSSDEDEDEDDDDDKKKEDDERMMHEILMAHREKQNRNESDSWDSSTDDELYDLPEYKKPTVKKAESPITEDYTLKVYAENNLHDLPPIRDVSNLDIDFDKEEFLHMGNVEAVIETLVTIEALPGMPAYDLDTCLFIEDKTSKKAVGAVYDVIGPVTSPLYCLRFQHGKDISDLNLKKGMKVYCAPKTKYTKYVFVSELMKHKGTDASWVDDAELPAEVAAQLSDDEGVPAPDEPRKPQKRKHGSQERYKRYERNMNHCNTINSQATHYYDDQRQHTSRIRHNAPVPVSGLREMLTVFNPSVPPPMFRDMYPNNQVPMTLPPPMMWQRPPMMPRVNGSRGSFLPVRHHFNNRFSTEPYFGPGSSSHPH